MLVYLAAVSIVTFITWGVDKFRARAGQWRVSERVLFGMTLLGGAFGALAGMVLFRHKTRKPLFWLVVGVGCIFYAVLLILVGQKIG